MFTFIKAHSVRIFALVSAAATILAAQFPEVPWEALVGASAALLGVGEVTQRVENKKTAKAKTEPVPAPAPVVPVPVAPAPVVAPATPPQS